MASARCLGSLGRIAPSRVVGHRAGNYALFTLNADGTRIARLTHGPEATHASWRAHQ
jgi:hypothetical protein